MSNFGSAALLVLRAGSGEPNLIVMRSTNNNNTLCITETLNNLEPYTGSLTASNIDKLVTGIVGGGSIPNLPSNVTCTDCTKAAYNILQMNFGDLVDGYSGSISSTCGASFIGMYSPWWEALLLRASRARHASLHVGELG